MGYRNLQECVRDLEATGRLRRIEQPVDPFLEVPEIQRRAYRAGGPALLFTRPKDCAFPLLSNLFGSIERVRYMFRDSLAAVERLVALKGDPGRLGLNPSKYAQAALAGWHALPRAVSSGPVLQHEIRVADLPRITSWPNDGGPFITLPQVYTEDPRRPGWRRSNLGMYRVQLAGGQYERGEVGLHYQIHRGIGVHHAAALERGERLPVSVFVGGPPAMTVAAVMPLPEGLPEVAFAGALGGRRVKLIRRPGQPALHAEADFCLTGYIDPQRRLPEGPFGDHLGYYSLAHDFPVLRVERVYHRAGAIWPFTVVGRPPQEDTTFGQFVHELTGPVIPTVIPGIQAVHAVDAAGVHPLLLAIGSERYAPYAERRRPQELLTQANAILGQGQMSLAKFLWIAAREDAPDLDIHNIGAFLEHMLRRLDMTRDLHFQTCTTIDTLDYSGDALNEGSKLVLAAVGPPLRELPGAIPAGISLPAGYGDPRIAMKGVLAVRGPAWSAEGECSVNHFCATFRADQAINAFPLIVLVDDSAFVGGSFNNFLWTTFTRANPAADVEGIESFVRQKHWGCRGSLVIDARAKPHHAPPLVEDPEISRRVDALAAKGGPLAGII